jgi:hypothetical protein
VKLLGLLLGSEIAIDDAGYSKLLLLGSEHSQRCHFGKHLFAAVRFDESIGDRGI